MNSVSEGSSFNSLYSQFWDRRLWVLLLLGLIVAGGDFQSRLMVSQPISQSSSKGSLNSPSVPLVSNRTILPSEFVSLVKYLKTFSLEPKPVIEQANADRSDAVFELARLNEELFGKAGFRLVAVFLGEDAFAVIEILDKSTQQRRFHEARVGEDINGYRVESLSEYSLTASGDTGEQVVLALFGRNGSLVPDGSI